MIRSVSALHLRANAFWYSKRLFVKYNVCFGKGKDVTELGLGYSFDVVGWCQGIHTLAVAKGFVLMDLKPSMGSNGFVLSEMGGGRRHLLALWLHG